MTEMTATTETAEFTSPCGCGGCEKWADCFYCETCIEKHPWVAASAEALEDERWAREHAGSFGEWLAAR